MLQTIVNVVLILCGGYLAWRTVFAVAKATKNKGCVVRALALIITISAIGALVWGILWIYHPIWR